MRRVVWPRYGAFEELIDERLGVTHLIDLTILYHNQENALSIFDIAKGIRREPVYFLYRVYEIYDESEPIISEREPSNHYTRISRKNICLEWLQSLWKEKEQILDEFYSDQNKFFQTYGNGKKVDLSYLKILFVHTFYIVVSFVLVCASYLSYNAASQQFLNH